jgi:hypothetical protein
MSAHPIASAALAALLLASAGSAQGPLKSGPQVGARNDRSGFLPRWVTGPCAGKHLCPV